MAPFINSNNRISRQLRMQRGHAVGVEISVSALEMAEQTRMSGQKYFTAADAHTESNS